MSKTDELFGPGSRDYESTSDRIARRNVRLAEARDRRRGRWQIGGAVGALALAITSLFVLNGGDLPDRTPHYPVAGSSAARDGVHTGEYQIIRMGEDYDFCGHLERISSLAEIARIATAHGQFGNATEVQAGLFFELERMNDRDGTKYDETTIPPDTPFVVPVNYYC